MVEIQGIARVGRVGFQMTAQALGWLLDGLSCSHGCYCFC